MSRVINLFPDQSDLINRVRQSMRVNKSVLLQASTGSGKTVMSAAMIQAALNKGSRSVFIVPRDVLLRQTAETFEAFGIPFGYFAAGYKPNPFAKVHLASGPTLARRLDRAPVADVVFVDETHHGSTQLESIIRHYQAAGAWVIGLSATPWKMSGQGLGDWYDAMEQGPSLRELIQAKRLSEYRLFAPSRPNLDGIKTVAGDYAKGELTARMEADRVLIGDAVKHYGKHAAGKLNVAFCTSLKHAEIVADAFAAQGIPAAMVSGSMDEAERSRRIKAFARRELHVLASVDLLTFGFDLASAAQMDVTIECMSDMRPTKSLSLQLQKFGRVLRYKPQPAIIFDHASNTQIHGMPDDEREWSLASREKRRGNSDPTQPVRQCGSCFFCHRPSPICPNCGTVYEVKSRMIDEVDGDLQEISASISKQSPRREQGMARGLDDLIRLGRSKGYKNPQIWAEKVMRGRLAKNRNGP